MAMNRANFAKMLEPGLNTLLDSNMTAIHPNMRRFSNQILLRRHLRKTFFYQVLEMLQQNQRVLRFRMTQPLSSGLRVISTKQSLWLSQSAKKLKKMASMARLLLAIQKRWLAQWPLLKRSKRLTF